MSKIMIKPVSAFLIAVIVFMSFSVTGNLHASDVVVIPDENLETAIRAALSKPAGDILAGDMESLTNLTARGRGICDLTGLEYAVNLSSLDLGYNVLSDLAPLAGLTNLESLRLDFSKVSDITPLSGLNNLQHLYLDSNLISDLTPLSALNNLWLLDLSANNISDLVPLSGLTGLFYLNLSSNAISDITPLSTVKYVWRLHLSSNAISDIALLSDFANLDVLDLSNNAISDISPLTDLTRLMFLYLSSNAISDLTPLSGIPVLWDLFLSANNISDISPLLTITHIHTLDLSSNHIENLATLSGRTELKKLNLGSNLISDLAPLSDLINLEYLYLGSNPIEDLTPLSGLTELRGLYLHSINVIDISPLSDLNKLGYLDLSSNAVNDLSPLSGLIYLGYLYLSSNAISDLSPLSSLSNLLYLDLSSNVISNLSPLSDISYFLKHLNLNSNLISDVTPLSGFTGLEQLYLRFNNINISAGSPAMDIIQSLIDEGVSVYYKPQGPIVPVEIPDDNLEAAIREALDKPAGELTTADMALLNSLEASSCGIEDLTGLEYAVNLIYLDLNSNLIADLSALAGLTDLISLDLRLNGLDITTGSPAMDIIGSLMAEGVVVLYEPQFMLYVIDVSAEPSYGGNVTGADTYDPGDMVTVMATPAIGYQFIHWTEDSLVVSNDAAYSFTATADRILVANFILKTYTITVSAEPVEGGNADGAGVYNHGEQVTVTAAANTGFSFISWTEDAEEVNLNQEYIFIAYADRTLVANFQLNTGWLSINIEPSAARDAGAQWSIDGGDTWFDSSSQILPTDIYSINFKDIPDWETPSSITGVEVMSGQTTARTVYYGEIKDVTPENGSAVVDFPHSMVGVIVQTGDSGSITVIRYQEDDLDVPPGMEAAGIYLQIERSSSLAGCTARIEVNYDREALPDHVLEESLRLWRYNATNETWEILPGGVDSEKCIVWGETDDFSVFGVFGEGLFRFGDVNEDGNIDVSDAILVLRHIVGLTTLTGNGLAASDVNRDGRVDVADAILILRFIGGVVPSL